MKTIRLFGITLATVLLCLTACDKNKEEEPTPAPSPVNPTIIVQKTEYNISANGGAIEVSLQSDVDFKININAQWVTQVSNASSRGLASHSLHFKIAPNTAKEERNAKITISDTSNKVSKNINIKQNGAVDKTATMVDGYTFNNCLKEIYGELSNLKSIEFIVNDNSEPNGDYKILSTSESECPIYGVDNNGHLTIYTGGDKFTLSPDSYGIFGDCSSLTSLDLSNLDTSNTTDMGAMFWRCSSLTSLDLSNFDTSNATSLRGMFYECSSLTSINLSNFDTSNVTNMIGMFKKCSSLASLNLSNFNTTYVTTTEEMFTGCTSLTSLDLSNFDTTNITVMQHMFSNCSALSSLNLSNFNTSNVTIMYGMFYRCTNLKTLDLSHFDTSNVTDMTGMFNMCNSLSLLKLDNFTITESTDTKGMFDDFATNAESCTISIPEDSYEWIKHQLSTSHITITFSKESNIKTATMVDGKTFYSTIASFCSDFSKFQSIEIITNDNSTPENNFYLLSTPESEYPIYLTHTDIYGTKNEDHIKIFTAADKIMLSPDCHFMFMGFSSLTTLDLSHFDSSQVTNMSGMFQRCNSLTALDLSHFSTANVTNMSFMFGGCSEMTSLNIDKFLIKDSTNVTNMFENISSYSQNITITLPLKSYEWVSDQLTAHYIMIDFSEF